MSSLKQTYVLINSLTASVSIGAIALLFYVCNSGFRDLVNISATNLNALYTAGELKSLLWAEKAALDSNIRNSSTAPAKSEDFNKASKQVLDLSKLLESRSSGELQESISKFILTHETLNKIVKKTGCQKRRIRQLSNSESMEINQLYSKGYELLNDFGDAVLVQSQEQQGLRIRSTIRLMKSTLWGTIGFTLAAIFLSFLYFRKHVIDSILKISGASLRAAHNDFTPIQNIISKDEIGILAANFNHMMGEIHLSSEIIRAERDIAEKANQTKSVFLANMSHELRTPMHGILSFARFGQQKYTSAAPEKLKSYFDEIYDSGSRLMMLLNDILDLSKLEAGKIVYSMQEKDFVDSIQTVIAELKAFAEEKGLRIETTNNEPLLAYYDDLRVMQVVRNILSNAVKFSTSGTAIRITVSTSADLLTCCIANRGVGVPESELKSIFDKFIQSSKTRTGAGGTGLGLAICKEIIEQHGGKIWAESELNQETRFIFEIPKAGVKKPEQG